MSNDQVTMIAVFSFSHGGNWSQKGGAVNKGACFFDVACCPLWHLHVAGQNFEENPPLLKNDNKKH